ncbi:MAG: prepilin peptidase, partial [Pseudomonadales bacterium]
MLNLYVIATNTILFTAAALLLGLLIGSFLNVVVYRLPVMMQREWQGGAKNPFIITTHTHTPTRK